MQVVDLGPKSDLKRLGLRSGQEVTVSGHQGQVNGETALLAESIQTETGRIKIQREGQETTMSGKIKEFRQAQIGENQENHLMVRLQTEQGEEIAVDCGPNASEQDLGLKREDRVRVTGQKGEIDGKSVLIARQIAQIESSGQQ